MGISEEPLSPAVSGAVTSLGSGETSTPRSPSASASPRVFCQVQTRVAVWLHDVARQGVRVVEGDAVQGIASAARLRRTGSQGPREDEQGQAHEAGAPLPVGVFPTLTTVVRAHGCLQVRVLAMIPRDYSLVRARSEDLPPVPHT